MPGKVVRGIERGTVDVVAGHGARGVAREAEGRTGLIGGRLGPICPGARVRGRR